MENTEVLAVAPLRIGVLGCGDHAAWALKRIRERMGFCALVTDYTLDIQWSEKTSGALATAETLMCPFLDTNSAEGSIEFLLGQRLDVLVLAGTRWVLPREFILALKGNIINLHPSNLPQHRGAGVYSWQILNGISESFISAYWVGEGIDDGPIIFQLKDQFTTKLTAVTDFIESHSRLFLQAIEKIIELAQGNILLSQKQNCTNQTHNESSYFPLLRTIPNGAIDWNWKLADLDSFIRAFSHPYPGAYTFYRSQKFHILEATPLDGCSMHPFCHGLVIRHTPDGAAHIACEGGSLILNSIIVDGAPLKPSDFLKLGGRIWTPSSILDEAKIFRNSNTE